MSKGPIYYLDKLKTGEFMTLIKSLLNNKVDKVNGKGLSTNDYTTTEKNKLAGIAEKANNYSLPPASSSTRGGVKTGFSSSGKNYAVQLSNEEKMYVNVPWTDTDNNTWKANSSSSEGYVASGKSQPNKVWKTDANGNPAWRDDANTTYGAASQSSSGLMSANDKKKLDGIASGANAYSLPLASDVRGGVKTGYSESGKNYAVKLQDEKMYVHVPWTDTNTTYSTFKGASASADGGSGLVPSPAAGAANRYLRSDGTWSVPPDNNTWKANSSSSEGYVTSGSGKPNKVWKTDANGNPAWRDDANTTYGAASRSSSGLMSSDDKKKLDGIASGANAYSLPLAGDTRGGVKTGFAESGKNYAVKLQDEKMYVYVPWTDTNTTYSTFKGASASAAGRTGLVPAPALGAANRYLRSDGTWSVPPDNNTWKANSSSSEGYVASGKSQPNKVWKTDANGNPAWRDDANTTYGSFKGCTASAAGGTGLVPAPAANSAAKYLRADGTWQTPPNTTYANFKGATASAAGVAGLVPPPSANNRTKYLRGDGTWQTPPNTQVSVIDTLTSTNKSAALSANQGKVLADLIEDNNFANVLNGLETITTLPKGSYILVKTPGAYQWMSADNLSFATEVKVS